MDSQRPWTFDEENHMVNAAKVLMKAVPPKKRDSNFHNEKYSYIQNCLKEKGYIRSFEEVKENYQNYLYRVKQGILEARLALQKSEAPSNTESVGDNSTVAGIIKSEEKLIPKTKSNVVIHNGQEKVNCYIASDKGKPGDTTSDDQNNVLDVHQEQNTKNETNLILMSHLSSTLNKAGILKDKSMLVEKPARNTDLKDNDKAVFLKALNMVESDVHETQMSNSENTHSNHVVSVHENGENEKVNKTHQEEKENITNISYCGDSQAVMLKDLNADKPKTDLANITTDIKKETNKPKKRKNSQDVDTSCLNPSSEAKSSKLESRIGNGNNDLNYGKVVYSENVTPQSIAISQNDKSNGGHMSSPANTALGKSVESNNKNLANSTHSAKDQEKNKPPSQKAHRSTICLCNEKKCICNLVMSPDILTPRNTRPVRQSRRVSADTAETPLKDKSTQKSKLQESSQPARLTIGKTLPMTSDLQLPVAASSPVVVKSEIVNTNGSELEQPLLRKRDKKDKKTNITNDPNYRRPMSEVRRNYIRERRRKVQKIRRILKKNENQMSQVTHLSESLPVPHSTYEQNSGISHHHVTFSGLAWSESSTDWRTIKQNHSPLTTTPLRKQSRWHNNLTVVSHKTDEGEEDDVTAEKRHANASTGSDYDKQRLQIKARTESPLPSDSCTIEEKVQLEQAKESPLRSIAPAEESTKRLKHQSLPRCNIQQIQQMIDTSDVPTGDNIVTDPDPSLDQQHDVSPHLSASDVPTGDNIVTDPDPSLDQLHDACPPLSGTIEDITNKGCATPPAKVPHAEISLKSAQESFAKRKKARALKRSRTEKSCLGVLKKLYSKFTEFQRSQTNFQQVLLQNVKDLVENTKK